MHCESAVKVRGVRMWIVGAEADSEPRVYTTVFGITRTHYIGKATPLQALAGPEGSRKLRLPDFKTIGT
jgi:hypothetical protein